MDNLKIKESYALALRMGVEKYDQLSTEEQMYLNSMVEITTPINSEVNKLKHMVVSMYNHLNRCTKEPFSSVAERKWYNSWMRECEKIKL